MYIYIYMYVCARVHTLHVYQLFKCRVVASNNANTYFFLLICFQTSIAIAHKLA